MSEPEATDDDLDVDAWVRRSRRIAALRFAVVGLVSAVAGFAMYLYGGSLARRQEGSEVQFGLPDQLRLAGATVLVLSGVFLLIAAVTAARARRPTHSTDL